MEEISCTEKSVIPHPGNFRLSNNDVNRKKVLIFSWDSLKIDSESNNLNKIVDFVTKNAVVIAHNKDIFQILRSSLKPKPEVIPLVTAGVRLSLV